MSTSDGIVAQVPWIINPFRGDKFEAAWLPAAEAALDFGATGWALFRGQEGGLDFTQLAFMPTKLDFERYWYSDEIGKARESISGWFHVPLVPIMHNVSGMGSLAPTSAP